MKEIQYILVDTGSESNRSMMRDVGKMDNGIQITDFYKTSNPFLKKMIRLHFSYRLNCKRILPGKSIWNKLSLLKELTSDNNKEYYIIIVNNAIHRCSISLLNSLSRRENIHLVSLIIDAFDQLPANIRKMIRMTEFEQLYSFQKSDCERYGFLYTNQIYSKDDLPRKNDKPTNDVYFIGLAKDRIDEIYAYYHKLSDEGLNCCFQVIVPPKKRGVLCEKYPGLILLTKRIGYNQILEEISDTKCILEICQKGQDGLTMRFYEALFYNKFLITNNKTALSHEMYHPQYMQVVDSPEDISIASLMSKDPIDYGYKGEMSPVHFVNGLCNKNK